MLRDLQVARAKVAARLDTTSPAIGRPILRLRGDHFRDRCNEHRRVAALRELRRAHPPLSLMRLLPAHAIILWNDHRRRTQREVVDLFDRAIDKRMGRVTTASEIAATR